MSGVRGGDDWRAMRLEVMRRVLCIFAILAAVMSALLAVAVSWVWVRSHQQPEWWSQNPYDMQTHRYGTHLIGSERGKMVLLLYDYKIDDSFAPVMAARGAKGDFSGEWKRQRFYMTSPTWQHWWERVVFVVVHKNVRLPGPPGICRVIMMIVPHWVLVVLFLAWPGVWGVRWW